jgi:hypothetical protein
MKKLVIMVPLFMMFVGCQVLLGDWKRDLKYEHNLEIARAGASKVMVNTPGTERYAGTGSFMYGSNYY